MHLIKVILPDFSLLGFKMEKDLDLKKDLRVLSFFQDLEPTISVFTMTYLNAFCIPWFLSLEFLELEDI